MNDIAPKKKTTDDRAYQDGFTAGYEDGKIVALREFRNKLIDLLFGDRPPWIPEDY